MNQRLRDYLRRLNHPQRLIRDSAGGWMWLDESGSANEGEVRLHAAPAGAADIAAFSGAVCRWPGSQASALLRADGRAAIALMRRNRAEVRLSDRWNDAAAVLSARAGELLIGNLVMSGGRLLLPWAIQHPDDASEVGISVEAGGDWRHFPLHRGRGAFAPHAAAGADGRIHLAWAQADQRVFYLVLARAGAEAAGPPACIARDGYQPSLLEDEEGVLVVYESHFAYPRSVMVRNGKASDAVSVCGDDPRFHYTVSRSLQLVRDEQGVPTLFFADAYRAHVFYSRWLGGAWSPVLSAPSLFDRSARDDRSYAAIERISAAQGGAGSPVGLILQPESERVGPRFRRYSAVRPDPEAIHFFDLREINRLHGFERRPQRGDKRPENPMIQPGPKGAFNSRRAVNRGTVARTGQGYAMWFTGASIPDQAIGHEWWTKLRSGHARSEDGLRWQKPREIKGLPGQHAVYVDATDADGARRYKFVDFLIADQKVLEAQAGNIDALAATEPGRLYSSADGMTWSWEPVTLAAEGGLYFEHCPMCLLDDPADPPRRWKSYGYASLTLGRRANTVATSADLIHWTLWPEPALPPERQGYPLQPTGPMSQAHGMTVQRIGACYVGLVQYQQDASRSIIELAVSRDGMHFDPIGAGQPVVDRGAPGAWDEGMLMPAGLIQNEEGWRIYYTGANLPKNGESIRTSLGAADFQTDGLCALTAGGEAAWLRTAPMALAGGETYELFIRSQSLLLRIEIVDSAGGVIARSSFAGGAAPAISFVAPDRPVCLKLYAAASAGGKLFSLSFRARRGET